jgi:hypothetical protein
MTMFAFRLLTIVVAFSLLVTASSAAAQGATPAASPSASAAPLDLAAMMPTLDDLGAPGYLINRGLNETIAEDVAATTPNEHTDVGERAGMNQQEGFKGQAQADYVIPSASGDGTVDRLVAVQVVEYIDQIHAMHVFDARMPAPKMLCYVTPLTLGDVAALSRAPGDSRHQILEVIFLSGPLLADIQFMDRGETPVDQARAEALGAIFAARIARVRAHGGPGLGAMTLRIPYGGTIQIDEDNYEELAGRPFRTSLDTDAVFADRSRATSEITDSYSFIAELGSAAALFTNVKRYVNESEAARGIQTQLTNMIRLAPSGDTTETVSDAPTFGDDSTVIRFTGADSAGEPLNGYLVFVRVGAMVARVMALSRDDLPLVTVAALARAQTACLEARTCPSASLATASVIASQLAGAGA